MRALLVLVAGLLLGPFMSFPAQAGERVNEVQVRACLDRERTPEDCLGTILAPCAHMARAGLLRACAWRLRLRWEEEFRALTGLAAPGTGPTRNRHYAEGIFPPDVTMGPSEPRGACTRALIARYGDGPGVIPTVRSACRLFRAAVRWYFALDLTDIAGDRDATAAEACIRSPDANAGCEQTLTGRCESGRDVERIACLTHAEAVFSEVLRRSGSASAEHAALWSRAMDRPECADSLLAEARCLASATLAAARAALLTRRQ